MKLRKKSPDVWVLRYRENLPDEIVKKAMCGHGDR